MRKTVSVALVLLLILSGATFTTVASPPTETENGLSPVEFVKLWSGDIDDGGYSSSDHDQNTELESVKEILATVDWEWAKPPKTPGKWNNGDVQDFNKGGISTSIYPTDATLYEAGPIKDAYIEIGTVSPKTVLHESGSQTATHVRQNGEIYGTTDYRVELPANETSGWPRTQYSITNTTTESITVYQKVDGALVPVGSGDASDGSFSIEYSDLQKPEFDENTKLVVKTTINVSTKKVIHHKPPIRDYDDNIGDGNNDETNGDGGYVPGCPVSVCGGGWFSIPENSTTPSEESETSAHTGAIGKGTHTKTISTHTVIVSDSVTVTVSSLKPKAHVGVFPDGSTHFRLTTKDAAWDHLVLPDGTEINNGWHYYAARDKNWDTLTRESKDSKETIQSEYNPVELHGFPPSDGVYSAQINGGVVIDSTGISKRKPTLPKNITVSLTDSKRFTYPFLLEVRSPHVTQKNVSGVSVHSVVRGDVYRGENDITVKNRLDVKKPVIEADDIKFNEQKQYVIIEVSITDPETGAPIATEGAGSDVGSSTRKNPAVVYVGDRPVEFAPGETQKTVKVKATSTEPVKIVYDAKKWYYLTKYGSYTSTETHVYPGQTLPDEPLEFLINKIVSYWELLIPYLITMRLLYALGFPTWPPYPRFW